LHNYSAKSPHRPTPLTIPNGIRILSAVLPQYTFQTDRHTDAHTQTKLRQQVSKMSAYARCTDTEQSANNFNTLYYIPLPIGSNVHCR